MSGEESYLHIIFEHKSQPEKFVELDILRYQHKVFEAISKENPDLKKLPPASKFSQGEDLDPEELPEFMKTPEMEQAMETIKQFSEKEESYQLYQSRVNFLREQSAIQQTLDRLEREKKAALKRENIALQREKETEKAKNAALQREKAVVKEKNAALQREKAVEKEKNALEERMKKMELELKQLRKTEK